MNKLLAIRTPQIIEKLTKPYKRSRNPYCNFVYETGADVSIENDLTSAASRPSTVARFGASRKL